MGRKEGIVDEVERAIMNEREACAQVVEKLAEDRRKMAISIALTRERAAVYWEIASALDRAAQFIRERESVVI